MTEWAKPRPLTSKHEWVPCAEDSKDHATHRMRVPGGYLYRETVWGGTNQGQLWPTAVSLVFVPDHEEELDGE